MPVGLLEEDIRLILAALGDIERIILGKTQAVVIFEEVEEDTINLAMAFNGYK